MAANFYSTQESHPKFDILNVMTNYNVGGREYQYIGIVFVNNIHHEHNQLMKAQDDFKNFIRKLSKVNNWESDNPTTAPMVQFYLDTEQQLCATIQFLDNTKHLQLIKHLEKRKKFNKVVFEAYPGMFVHERMSANFKKNFEMDDEVEEFNRELNYKIIASQTVANNQEKRKIGRSLSSTNVKEPENKKQRIEIQQEEEVKPVTAATSDKSYFDVSTNNLHISEAHLGAKYICWYCKAPEMLTNFFCHECK